MSASSIARWNSILLTRDSQSASNKRPRSHEDYEEGDIDDDNHPQDGNDVDSSEDNVSIVSRSPSPQPDRGVDVKDITLYDEHIRGVAREVITVETKIKSTNKGFAMLAKMGWVEGRPLGLSGEGRIDPVPFTVKQDSQGLGKSSQDFRMIETTVAQRRNLDSERMQFETEEQRLQREAVVAHKEAVRTEISAVLRPFYCELCDKQFQNVAQYDEHTNSYAHHHRVRLKDMNANHPMKVGGQMEIERRKEKERLREEKELRKMAKAAGIRMPASAAVAAAAVPLAHPSSGGTGGGFRKSGWTSVSSSAAAPAAPSSSTGGGWIAVSSPAVPSAPRTSSSFASGGPGSGWRAVSSPNGANPSLPPLPPPPTGAPPPSGPPSLSSPLSPSSLPSFVSGGWSTLTQSSNTLSLRRPPSPTPLATCAPPIAPPPTLPLPPPSAPAPLPAATPRTIPGAPSAQRGGWAHTLSPSVPPPVPAPAHAPAAPPFAPMPSSAPSPSPPSNARLPKDTTRSSGGSGGSSWRNFQKSRGRR